MVNSFSSLLIGSRGVHFKSREKKSHSSLRNVSHRQFMSSPKLMRTHGLWSDTDRDKVLNLFDCFPFNRKKHAIIPVSLQPPAMPQTLSQYQASKLPQRQVSGLTQEQISNIETKHKELSNLSYEDYFSKYNSLPDYMKEFFTKPEEIKGTSEYQSYSQQKTTYEQQLKYYEDYMTGVRFKEMGVPLYGAKGAMLEGYQAGSSPAEEARMDRIGKMLKEQEKQLQIEQETLDIYPGSTLSYEQQLQLKQMSDSAKTKQTYFGSMAEDIKSIQQFGRNVAGAVEPAITTLREGLKAPGQEITPTQRFIREDIIQSPVFETFFTGQTMVDWANERGSNLLIGEVDISGAGSYDDVGDVLSSSRFGKKKRQPLLSELGESKFSSLGDDLQREYAEELLTTIQRDVLNKKTLREQLEYLSTQRSKLTTQQAKDNFDNFVKKEIYDKGFIKPFVEVSNTGQVISNIPTKGDFITSMKGANVVAFLGLPTNEVRNAFKEKAGVKTETYGFSDNPLFSTANIPQTGTKQEIKLDSSQTNMSSLLFGQPQRELAKQKEKQEYGQPQSTITSLLFGQPQSLKEEQRTIQRTKQEYKQPEPEEPSPFGFGLTFRKKDREDSRFGYFPYARIDATKKDKASWRKLSKKPLTRNTALGVMSEFVDKNISAKGQIKPVRVKNPDEISKQRNNYFDINQHKFREWKQRKGVRSKTPMTFIELERYRADSPKEVRALKVGKQQTKMSNFLYGNNSVKKRRGYFRL